MSASRNPQNLKQQWAARPRPRTGANPVLPANTQGGQPGQQGVPQPILDDDKFSKLYQYQAENQSSKLLSSLVAAGTPYRYAFSFCCDLDENTESMQELTGGVRKQVKFISPLTGTTAWSDQQTRPNVISMEHVSADRRLMWNGEPLSVRGSIASGDDWLVVDNLGVATFNARVTLKFEQQPYSGAALDSKDNVVLVDATIKGTVDLAHKHVQDEYVTKHNPQVVEHFSQKNVVFNLKRYLEGGAGKKAWVPVCMSVRFEGPAGPLASDGADRTWIPAAEQARQAAYITHYGALSRGQFFAAGHVYIDQNRKGWPAEKIELHVIGLQPTWPTP